MKQNNPLIYPQPRSQSGAVLFEWGREAKTIV